MGYRVKVYLKLDDIDRAFRTQKMTFETFFIVSAWRYNVMRMKL